MAYESLLNNKNAEKWTEQEALILFHNAISLTKGDSNYDFIGEVAKELNTYREIFTYLNNKFEVCKPLHNQLISNIESNCFSHGKKGEINTAMAIVNLKSNHGWTDRVDTTSKDKEIKTAIINLGNGTKPDE